jgi:hypothetical protein
VWIFLKHLDLHITPEKLQVVLGLVKLVAMIIIPEEHRVLVQQNSLSKNNEEETEEQSLLV